MISQLKKCEYLNETILPEEQAEKLGITVDLYEQLVAARRLYSDRTDSGRLAQAVRFFISYFYIPISDIGYLY